MRCGANMDVHSPALVSLETILLRNIRLGARTECRRNFRILYIRESSACFLFRVGKQEEFN
jgi:hypothetical protein